MRSRSADHGLIGPVHSWVLVLPGGEQGGRLPPHVGRMPADRTRAAAVDDPKPGRPPEAASKANVRTVSSGSARSSPSTTSR